MRAYFTIDGMPVEVGEDWSLRSSAFGGYETGRFTIKASDIRAHPFGIDQGAPVAAFTQGGLQIWEGKLPTAPRIGEDGRAEVTTVGPWIEAEASSELRLFQIRGARDYTEGDSDPYNYSQNDGFDLSSGNGKVQYKAVKGEDFVAGQVASFVIWKPGAHFTRYAFVINKNRDDAEFSVRVRGALGPSGSLTTIDTYSLSSANPTGTEKINATLSGDYDLLAFQILCDTDQSALSERLRVWLTSLRVNDLAADDDLTASDAAQIIGEALGWNTDAVQSTGANVLPVSWEGPWSELLIYLADLEDNYVRRTYRGLEFGPWGDQTWEARRSYSARPDLRPLELANRAVVHYETIAGAPAQVTADPDVDPLPGRLEVIDYDLADPQHNSTLATAVAERMVERYAKPRYVGNVDVFQNRHQAGPLAIMPGDVLDVADWDLGISQPLRIHGVEYRADRATCSIEMPISMVNVLDAARAGLGKPQRRGRNRSAPTGGPRG